jgi:hypothetical protein
MYMHDFFRQPARALSSVTVAMCMCAWMQAALAQPTKAVGDEIALQSDTAVATAGYFQLTWNAEGPVRLVESNTPDFRNAVTLYTGSDSGRTISGRGDGDLYYRIESAATGAVLGEPLRVTVTHHPLSRALTFFGIGAVVFVATLTLIVVGTLQSAQSPDAS